MAKITYIEHNGTAHEIDVKPGMTVMVNDGSMAALLGASLTDKAPLTVITNNAAVIERLKDAPRVTLIALGGTYSAKFNGFFGVVTEDALSRLRADLAFISTPAVAGLRAFHMDDAAVRAKRAMMAAADRAVLLVNHARFGRSALHALAEDPYVEACISNVLMPDQGNQHPADEPDFAEAEKNLNGKLEIFQQGNLGGSGGYSRIMYEALENTDSPFILYMDDDIAIEPDSVLRAVQAARYAAKPIIVGGQMLNLQERSQLRTTGEQVNRADFMWGAAPHAVYDHDFAKYPLRAIGTRETHLDPKKYDSRALHRRVDVEYNGWWMCLFPRIVAETNGQPLPLFIKWDDTEYSLRAARNGFPTVTWPGAAIWHMAWADKDDAIDWQAYFHLRNRLIVAAMYHEGPAKGITKSIFKSTLKHTMCMEYSTMAIQIEAMRDFLAGPDHLFDILESSLPRIAQIRKNYSDAVILESADELPAPTGAPGVPTRNIGGRLAKIKKIPWAIKGLKHLVSKEDAAHHEAPQLNLTPDEARWFTLSRVDSATVSTAGGTGVAFRKRDRDLAKDLVTQTRELLKEIEENFDDLRAEYRAAQPELTSRESWKKVFDAQ